MRIRNSRPMLDLVIGLLAIASISGAAAQGASDTGLSRSLEPATDSRALAEKFWLSTTWYEQGIVDNVENHDVIAREITYVNPSDQTKVMGLLLRPKGPGRYPGVLLAHGRRGFDPLVGVRLAARGLVVLLPDLYAARFIENFPVAHLTATEGDLDAGVDALLKQDDISVSKICVMGLSRGGYYALRSAVGFARQDRHVACYIGYYPHWQDPAAPEPDQVYRYSGDIDRLRIPTLVFIGELDQYQRRRSIETGVHAMRAKQRDVRLIVYPAVGRGFDFRPPNVSTFADYLATRDANQRTAAFIALHLKPWSKP